MPNELWPPLQVIRAHLEPGAPAAGGHPPPGDTPDAQGAPADAGADLLLPITELARRREALAARNFGARWAPGRIVSVLHEGRLLGVLLDRQLPDGAWQGFMAAGEADWAGVHDVLLEPDDEPFEPLFGMVQAWNVVTLMPSPQWVARVQGELSATRLAAVRAVHDEFAAGQATDIEPQPGRIALRATGGGAFSVLSGTPLGARDERAAYQHLYRDVAARLVASGKGADMPSNARFAAAAPAAPDTGAAAGSSGTRTATADDDAQSAWSRLRRWLGADGWVRPAFAALALVVVVQNIVPMGMRVDPAEDEVRFRGAPQLHGDPSADLVLQWKAGVRIEEAQRLLQTQQADIVAGPDARGMWFVRVPDPAAARAALAASPLVESVGLP
ncbi:hypothetical protein QTH91_10680 [Variovorax dokdonensis]|uniref:Transmembrane protein n=1 Tax=Variovorax dokdonensis TaxID=344883 RepID=A0ABT7NAH8_9BURK|nr:hypothetical protein [Variovorax dokdonensis]MDM0044951.1 hypothetical protein [Variovorax dokdonensis]